MELSPLTYNITYLETVNHLPSYAILDDVVAQMSVFRDVFESFLSLL